MFDLELQKFCGARFFNWDLELYHEVCRNSAKYFTPCSSVSIVNFEEVNVCWGIMRIYDPVKYV